MSTRRTPVSVRRTPDFDDDLAVLQRGGLSASDAVRQAVRLIAQAHRTVEQMEARDGQRPDVLSIRTIDLIRPYDARQRRRTDREPDVIQDGGKSR